MSWTQLPWRASAAVALGLAAVVVYATFVASPVAEAAVDDQDSTTAVPVVVAPIADAIRSVDAPDRLTNFATVAVARAADTAVWLASIAAPEPPARIHCPVPGSQFVDSWGFSRSGGRRHKGVDMMAGYGTPVIAPVAGVVRSSSSSLGGIGFYLDDEAGNEYFGSHMASLDVTGRVEAGTQIGTVGSTGNAGTPHLHFEIAPGGGAAVNPYPFAIAWCLADPAEPWVDLPVP